MVKRRRGNPFSLSFLDIMACGFGAVTLLFLILRHNTIMVEVPDIKLAAEVDLLEQDIRQAEVQRVELLNSIEEIEKRLVEAQGASRRYVTELTELEESIQSDPNQIDMLRRQVEELERETAAMDEIEFGDKVRQFLGDGNRQYLTGLKLGGERVLIMVDASASMLDDNVVNVIRRRNMSDDLIRTAPKWVWAMRTVEWLLAQLPPSSRFQIYLFNTETSAALPDTEGEWLDAADSLALEDAVSGMRQFVPGGGTSLERAFESVNEFQDRPDNIFLLTDGLPTQGRTPPKNYMVSGEQRRRHFINAVAKVPRGVPINTILFPMEGDPEAAALFWQLAMNSEGAFIAPSRDWP